MERPWKEPLLINTLQIKNDSNDDDDDDKHDDDDDDDGNDDFDNDDNDRSQTRMFKKYIHAHTKK